MGEKALWSQSLKEWFGNQHRNHLDVRVVPFGLLIRSRQTPHLLKFVCMIKGKKKENKKKKRKKPDV